MPRILLVDDEDASRYSICKALENAGFDVVAASDHRAALDEINSDRTIDLLLTDVVIPNSVNGFALARMARMRRPKLKVLYVTAYDLPTEEAEGTVLRKPVENDVVIAEVHRTLAD